jgi:hypothetical protein
MSDTIVVLDRSTVREGKLVELKRAMKELASFVDENEPGRSPTTSTSMTERPR